MVAERFEVGEVAILNREGSRWHTQEVTVISALQDFCWIDEQEGRWHSGAAYEIKIPDYNGPFRWVAEPRELKKRRPPQDWVKLCRLTERTDEVVA
jgi:hypothetical protein